MPVVIINTVTCHSSSSTRTGILLQFVPSYYRYTVYCSERTQHPWYTSARQCRRRSEYESKSRPKQGADRRTEALIHTCLTEMMRATTSTCQLTAVVKQKRASHRPTSTLRKSEESILFRGIQRSYMGRLSSPPPPLPPSPKTYSYLCRHLRPS